MATINLGALAAFGRNDIRGTYRDPLLVMIVLAPVIWTTGVAVLTPRFTEMLAKRYDFEEQTSTDTEEGRRPPDVTVRLPGGGLFVIDAKCSLNAFLELQDATDEAARATA